MEIRDVLYCPYCKDIMDIDSRVVSQETILKNPKVSCVIKASCMKCLIQVTITGNLRNEDAMFKERIQQDKIFMFKEMLKLIPKENRPAFVTARKKEAEERLEYLQRSDAKNEQQIKETMAIIEFFNKYIEEEPWGDYA